MQNKSDLSFMFTEFPDGWVQFVFTVKITATNTFWVPHRCQALSEHFATSAPDRL